MRETFVLKLTPDFFDYILKSFKESLGGNWGRSNGEDWMLIHSSHKPEFGLDGIYTCRIRANSIQFYYPKPKLEVTRWSGAIGEYSYEERNMYLYSVCAWIVRRVAQAFLDYYDQQPQSI